MRILVCGDRSWNNIGIIRREMINFEQDTVIIYGAVKSVDILAVSIANELGFKIISFDTDWNTYGKAAGFIRNRQMLIEGKPDLVIAFHTNINNSKCTKSMIEMAIELCIKTIIISR